MPDENVPPLINPSPEISPAQPVVNTTPVSPIPKKSKVMVWMVAILVLVVVLGLVGYWLLAGKATTQKSPTQVELTNIPTTTIRSTPTATSSADISTWKTYTSKKYNFSVQYPGDTEVKDFPVSQTSTDTFSFMSTTSPTECVNIHIDPKNIGSSDNFLDWIKKDSTINGEVKLYINSNNRSITGYWGDEGTEVVSKVVFIRNNTQVIEFSVYGCQTGDSYQSFPKAQDILEKMVSTFKFTN